MSFFPEKEILDEQIKDQDSTYKCFNCNKTFLGKEMLFEDGMPSNFSVAGVDAGQKLPKCPHCEAVAFFGFRKV